MKRGIPKRLAVVLVSISCFMMGTLSQAQGLSVTNETTIRTRYEEARLSVEASRTSTDVLALARIGEKVRALPVPVQPGESQSWRSEKLKLWLDALNKVEMLKDPEFDPNDVPAVNVATPYGSTASAGADPSAIKDPELRAQYQRAIDLNAERSKRYLLQTELRKLDQEWILEIRTYVSGHYDLPKEASEIGKFIDDSTVGAPRKAELKNAILQKPDRR